MTDRLGNVKQQLLAVGQLESVMTAIRGIAAARLHVAQAQLDGIQAYANTVAAAIGETLTLLPGDISRRVTDEQTASELAIVLTAEHGFVGAFNERILDVALHHATGTNLHGLFLVGTRGQVAAQSRKIPIHDCLSMVTRLEAIPALAYRLADMIYSRIGGDNFSRVSLIHAKPGSSGDSAVVTKSLIPFDYSRFPTPVRKFPPLITLEPVVLVNQLAAEYVFAELCETLTLSHAAENEARVHAMVRARSNVAHTRSALRDEYQQLRQDQITAEISELTTGRIAGLRSI